MSHLFDVPSSEGPMAATHGRLQLHLSDRRLVLRLVDTVLVVLATVVAILLWSLTATETVGELFQHNLYWFPLLVFLWLTLASVNDLYDLTPVQGRQAIVKQLLAIIVQTLIIYLIVFFVLPRDFLPRLFILYYAILSLVLVSTWHLLSLTLFELAIDARRVMFVGRADAAKDMIEYMNTQTGEVYEVGGVFDEQTGDRPADLPTLVQKHGVSELIITSARELSPAMFTNVLLCYEQGITITQMPLLYERITGRVPVEYIINDWVTILANGSASALDIYPLAKRIVDVLLALVGLVGFALLFPFIALAIRLDSRGGVIYSQVRCGQAGQRFTLYKLRTMVADAEAQTGAVFAQQGDPRVTRVGRFLRKTRLDEFPQLVNVLRGEMSIIGPRPERPEHVARLTETIPLYRTRLLVKPGLTGWAQVRYRYGSTDHDAQVKLEYDLYYIRHANLLFDFNIILRTVGKVLGMRGM